MEEGSKRLASQRRRREASMCCAEWTQTSGTQLSRRGCLMRAWRLCWDETRVLRWCLVRPGRDGWERVGCWAPCLWARVSCVWRDAEASLWRLVSWSSEDSTWGVTHLGRQTRISRTGRAAGKAPDCMSRLASVGQPMVPAWSWRARLLCRRSAFRLRRGGGEKPTTSWCWTSGVLTTRVLWGTLTRVFCATQLVAAAVARETTLAFWEALTRVFCAQGTVAVAPKRASDRASELFPAETLRQTRVFGLLEPEERNSSNFAWSNSTTSVSTIFPLRRRSSCATACSSVTNVVPSGVAISCWTRKRRRCKISLNQMKNYNRLIFRLQGREDVEAWIPPLFSAGFFVWRWRVNLVLRWPDDRLDRQGIFSLAGRRSNSAPSTKTLKEKVGEEQLVRSKLAWRVEEESSSLSLCMCRACWYLSVSLCLLMPFDFFWCSPPSIATGLFI